MEEQQAPRPRKSRRYTAPPQTVSDSVVLGVFAMPHGAGRPDPSRPPATQQPPASQHPAHPAEGSPGEETTDEAAAEEANAAGDEQTGTPGKAANAKKARKAGSGTVLPERAAEDDPRRWGDTDDDLGEWMRSQRPPHWD